MHVGNLFYTEPGMRLAGRLSDCSLGGRVFLCNSGTEAIECASSSPAGGGAAAVSW